MNELPLWIVRTARLALVAMVVAVAAPGSDEAVLAAISPAERAVGRARHGEAPRATAAPRVVRLASASRWRELPANRDGAVLPSTHDPLPEPEVPLDAVRDTGPRNAVGDTAASPYDAQAPPFVLRA